MRALLFAVTFALVGCLRGPAGEQGPPGPTGPPGMFAPIQQPSHGGAAGSGPPEYRPVFSALCSKAIDLVQPGDGVVETGLTYNATVYSNQDVQANCSVGLGQFEQANESEYLPATTVGSTDAGCVVAIDFPPMPATGGEVGFWTFQIQRGTPVAIYKDTDAGHPLNGFLATFEERDCSVWLWKKDDLVWTHTTLAEAFR